MITIIPQHTFNKIPWKNGQGSTLELAINQNGSLDDFNWRLSIAQVNQDGAFSDFSGYTRNLVLIDGQGMQLKHNEAQIDLMEKFLDLSTFDGADPTNATLISGPITDFNLMTKTAVHDATVDTFPGINTVTLKAAKLRFIYSPTTQLKILSGETQLEQLVIAGDLVQIDDNEVRDLMVTGSDLILVYIN